MLPLRLSHIAESLQAATVSTVPLLHYFTSFLSLPGSVDCKHAADLGQVAAYTLGKPAREVLFTVVSREEKYKAKLCIDTLIMRAGDTAAGGLFHLLDTLLHLGMSTLVSLALS